MLPSNKKGERRLLELYGGDREQMEREITGLVEEPRLMNRWADNTLRKDVALVVDGHDLSGPGPWANTPKWGEGAEKAYLKDPRVLRTLAVNCLICSMENRA